MAVLWFCACSVPLLPAQTADDGDRPVPILTGNAGFFRSVEGHHTELAPQITPVLLLPLGDKWLIEARAAFEGDLESSRGGPYRGDVDKDIDYLQADYIANRFVTVTAGRFLTPFGIYNERLYPIWIRSMPEVPLIYPIATGSSDGVMLRGGFSLNPKINLNYATYFSTLSTVNKFESDRTAGGRLGFFLPGPRIEAGASWQKLLQEERGNSYGVHFAWQPIPLTLNFRSEYAHSSLGSGYWVEAAYRLSQVPFWQKTLRHTEIVTRGEQFFKGTADEDETGEYGLPDEDTQEAEIGINYYLRDGLKATGSYGRRFYSDWKADVWTIGIAYRFAIPLGRVRPQ